MDEEDLKKMKLRFPQAVEDAIKEARSLGQAEKHGSPSHYLGTNEMIGGFCKLVDSYSAEDKLRAFIEEHNHLSVTGGSIYYQFCITSIGTAVVVGCHRCKKTEDLTDVSSW